MALFDSLACQYDDWYKAPLGKLVDRIEEKMVYKHLDPVKGRLALDAGCGTGLYSIRLARKGAYVIGIDQSEKMLEMALQKSTSITPVIQYFQGDLHHLPFQNNIFDLLICITALEFCIDPIKAIREFGRVLKPQGQMVLGVLNRESSWMKWVLSQSNSSSIYRKANLFIPSELKHLVQKSHLFKSVSLESGIYITPGDQKTLSWKINFKEIQGKWLHPMNGAFLLLSTRKKV